MKNAYLNNLQIHDNTQNIGYWLKPNIQGLEMPAIRLPIVERPNFDGASVPNQLYGGRAITLEGKVVGSTVAEYRSRREALISAVKIYRPAGVLTPITFKFKTMTDLELQVEVFSRKPTIPDKFLTSADYSLELFAQDYRIFSQELHQIRLNIFEGGGMSIPMAIPMDMSVGGSVETSVNNAGNIPSRPYIVIYGSIEDPTISNQTTDESFSIDYTLTTSDERIEIDMETRTVLYYSSPTATGLNIRQYFTGDWFELEPGNNTVKLTVAEVTDTGYAEVRWRDAYIGI